MNTNLRTALLVGTGTFVAIWAARRLTRNPALNPAPNELPPTYIPSHVPPPLQNIPTYIPPPNTVPPVEVQLPRQLSDMSVEPGHSYQAVVTVHAPLSWVASVDKVRREAEKQGFQNVDVQTNRPSGFAGSATGDYYVSATFGGTPTTMSRSNAGGQVSINDAWEV